MSDVATQEIGSSPAVSTITKKDAANKKTSKKVRGKPAHPPTSEMVSAAIKGLKERGGSSLQAIKKYISANYKVDAEKLSPFIKKYLKAAVTSGTLIQPKGKGASGSFKLAATSTTKAIPKKSASDDADKKTTVKKISKTNKKADSTNEKSEVKSATRAKKVKVAAKKAVAKKAPEPRTPAKMKKTTKVSVKKLKTPKPKTTRKTASSAKKVTTPKKR